MDHGLDRGLDYGPNSAGPPHAHISFSPCAHTVLYVDLTAKLALPCQLVHRPFDMFNTRVHFRVWLCSMTTTSHKSPHWSGYEATVSYAVPQERADCQCGLTLCMSYSDDQSEAYKRR